MSLQFHLDVENVLRSLSSDIGLETVDVSYVLKRMRCEGYKFLTVTLPKLSKFLLFSLEQGRFVYSKQISDFSRKGATLHFLQVFLAKIFDCNTGFLVNSPCAEAIRCIRQFCDYFYKIAIDYEAKTIEEATVNFAKNEQELKTLSEDPAVKAWVERLRKDLETYYTIGRFRAHEIFAEYRPRGTSGTFVGSTAAYHLERCATFSNQVPKANRGYLGYYKPYPTVLQRDAPISSVTDGSYSELLFVPKDSRGPRTICREFRVRLETQMAYFDFMCDQLHRQSDGAINFLSQDVNRALALEGSLKKNYSTCDLKDASDRVSFTIVKQLFRHSPGLRWFIDGANRANRIKMPDGSINNLHKLAGMGSGLTFPTMALLISLTITREIVNHTGLRYEDVRKSVFVYGDDIIVPSNWYKYVNLALAKVGLKVNSSKSFHNSNFRESCGADYFNGVSVAPVRLKLSNTKPVFVYNEHKRLILEISGNMSLKQLYEHSKECYENGLINLSRIHIGYAKKSGKLIPGLYSKDSGLLVDFFTKVSYPFDGQVKCWSFAPVVSPSKRLINGRLVSRCPYKYLAGKLNRHGGVDSSIDGVTLGRIAPASPTTFEEITEPRTLKLINRSYPSDMFLTEDVITSTYFHNYVVERARRIRVFDSRLAFINCFVTTWLCV